MNTDLMTNPLHRLSELGQAVWLDHISRPFVREGNLEKHINEDLLKGITSNPAIFDEALSAGDACDEDIRALSAGDPDPEEVFTRLAVKDIQDAADLFRPLYDDSMGEHGFVSLEVPPGLAHDSAASIETGRRLWQALERPNVMIKIPGTREGLEAIRTLLSEGISINVTLLFGLPRYREVTQAFIDGLRTRLDDAHAATRIASVASFFLSRIDSEIDPRLDRIAETKSSKAGLARSLRGKAAIASAKLAHQIHQEVFKSEAFEPLEQFGARHQRLLWASTSAKDPAYSDLKYIEPLVGAKTINTMPLKTLEACRDHGKPAPSLDDGVEESREVFDRLKELDIDIDEVTAKLEREGVEKFKKSYDSLLETVREKLSAIHV
ncbi:MAG: transaldolase [Opitutaceae bacterium]